MSSEVAIYKWYDAHLWQSISLVINWLQLANGPAQPGKHEYYIVTEY